MKTELIVIDDFYQNPDDVRAFALAQNFHVMVIPADQTVILNGGTTCYEVARCLQGRRVSVVTNSVPIASLLSADLATEVTLIGGYVYPRTGVVLGAMGVTH